MGRVDDGIDPPGQQELAQALWSAEPADADLAGRQEGVANTSGERGDDRESSLAGGDAGQFPGLPGSAQDQDVQGWPLK